MVCDSVPSREPTADERRGEDIPIVGHHGQRPMPPWKESPWLLVVIVARDMNPLITVLAVAHCMVMIGASIGRPLLRDVKREDAPRTRAVLRDLQPAVFTCQVVEFDDLIMRARRDHVTFVVDDTVFCHEAAVENEGPSRQRGADTDGLCQAIGLFGPVGQVSGLIQTYTPYA